MTNSPTLSLEERLLSLESMLPNAETLAEAELSFLTVNGTGSNPWAGACKKRDQLRQELTDVRRAIEGHKLSEAHERLREIDRLLAMATAERQVTDHKLKSLTENPTVQRWRGAVSVCIKLGIAHSFEKFRGWYESGRAVYDAMPEDGRYFLHSDEARAAGVSFDLGPDRETIRLYNATKTQSDVALSKWCTLQEEKAELLRRVPPLRSLAA